MNNRIDYYRYRKISIVIATIFLILFLLPRILIKVFEPELLNFRIMPAFWASFIFFYFRFIPRVHPIGRNSMLENIYLESIVCAAILIGIKFFAGSIIGEMGESPYILTPKGILNNLLFVMPPLFAREITRSYVLSTFCINTNAKAFVFVTIMFMFSDINYVELMTLSNLHSYTIFLAEEIGPILSQNIMLSYLALYGGPIAAFSYLGIITSFEWTSPILPVLNWLTKGAIGILVPIFALLTIIRKYENRVNNVKRKDMNKWEAVQWTFTALFTIGLIWFVVGVFPVVPSVIATGSMEPIIYPGDIILLEQVRTEDQIFNLKEGDIIQFQRNDIKIIHRIIEIEKDKSGNILFHTKGDNNSTEDSQTVDPNDIKGIYMKVIPKLGYPTLLLKGQRHEGPQENIEF